MITKKDDKNDDGPNDCYNEKKIIIALPVKLSGQRKVQAIQNGHIK